MPCIVVNNEFAHKTLVKELGFLFIGMPRDTHSVFQKRTNTQNKRYGAEETYTELCRTVDVWITLSFQTFFLEL